MITAYGDDNTRRRALEGGAEALLTKPIDFVALRGEMSAWSCCSICDVRNVPPTGDIALAASCGAIVTPD
jgi:CheY-like chemotaxis protein